MRHILLVILIGITLMGCGRREYAEMQKRLQQLNEYNKADSVFHNTTEAQILVDYFEKYGTSNEQMLAYYLLGRAYYDIHEAPLALNSFQTASEKADTTADNCDYRQLSRVYGQMSSLFYQQGLMLQSIKCDSISIKFAYEGCDTLTALLSMANQILAYKQLGNKDIALALCEKTSKLFSKHGFKQHSAIVLFPGINDLHSEGRECVQVGWNMEDYDGGLDVNGNVYVDPFINLGHELIHAQNYVERTVNYTPWFSNTKGGIVPYEEHIACVRENFLRAENGIPLRKYYATYGDSHKGYAPSIIENPRCLMNIVNSRKK